MKAIVIEAIEPIREYVVDLLGKEGFSVDQTDNGTIGLELVTKNDYQLVVTNVWLDELTGSAMIRKVRAKGINCPILIHSARMCWFDVIEGYMTGTQKRESLLTEDEWLAIEKERLDRREKRNNHCKGLVVE